MVDVASSRTEGKIKKKKKKHVWGEETLLNILNKASNHLLSSLALTFSN